VVRTEAGFGDTGYGGSVAQLREQQAEAAKLDAAIAANLKELGYGG
jgi:type I restriction enzyme M protein